LRRLQNKRSASPSCCTTLHSSERSRLLPLLLPCLSRF
jgi:hypothetical protein